MSEQHALDPIERRQECEDALKAGKFLGEAQGPRSSEGNHRWAYHFWELYLDGGADVDDGTTLTFYVDEADVIIFPELNGVLKVTLREDDNGFIHSQPHTTP